MLDAVRSVSAVVSGDGTPDRSDLPNLTQSQINLLPTIMGPASDPDSDSTARMDKGGYIYLWESGDDGIGFWVQAGYVRNGRQRFGQVIDPNDIKWFELGAYKKKLLRAKKSLNSVRFPDGDGIWDAGKEADSRDSYVQRWTENSAENSGMEGIEAVAGYDGYGPGGMDGHGDDSDLI